MFPLNDGENGEGTGLTKDVFFCLHYWAQEHQGVMIELGCPGNTTKFSESEIYHSLTALILRLGYSPDQVLASEMPTGNLTGPWKTRRLLRKWRTISHSTES